MTEPTNKGTRQIRSLMNELSIPESDSDKFLAVLMGANLIEEGKGVSSYVEPVKAMMAWMESKTTPAPANPLILAPNPLVAVQPLPAVSEGLRVSVFAEPEPGPLDTTKPAFELMNELGLDLDQVLHYGEYTQRGGLGDRFVKLDPGVVKANFEAEARQTAVQEARRAEMLPTDRVSRDRMTTSTRRSTNVEDREIIERLTDTALDFIKHSAGGRLYRPVPGEIQAICRMVGDDTGDLVAFYSDRVPANYTVLAYEYITPIRKGWSVRLNPMGYTTLRMSPEKSFPLYMPGHKYVMLAELASLSIVPDKCGACQKHLEQGLDSKLALLLEGRQYLRGKENETTRTLKELGLDPEDPEKGLRGELKFRHTHGACKIVLPIMAPIADAMDGHDLRDPSVKKEFLIRVVRGIRQKYEVIKLDPKNTWVTLKQLQHAAADIADVLLPDEGTQQ